jgi:hypothetical protein
MTWPLGKDWDEDRLEDALFGGPPRARRAELPMPDFAELHQPAAASPHATQQLLWEESIGPLTARLFERILADKPHPEMRYRGCLGIIRLAGPVLTGSR